MDKDFLVISINGVEFSIPKNTNKIWCFNTEKWPTFYNDKGVTNDGQD